MGSVDELVTAAVAGFGERLRAVRDEHWSLPTPCALWTVRELVGHVIEGNRLAVRLLGGEDRAPAGETVADFWRSVDNQTAAFAGADGDVRHPAGVLSAQRFAVYRAADIAVHTWDLARAIGADERLDAGLLRDAVRPYVAWVQTLDAPGEFGAANQPAGAGEQDRLLARLGRRP